MRPGPAFPPVHPTASTRFHLWWSPTKGFQPIKLQDINDAIKLAASAVESETGIPASLVSGASFRPGGATALLCAGISPDTIKLIGRWRSDAVQVYLRKQANTFSDTLSSHILRHGSFSFIAGATESASRVSIRTLHRLPNTVTDAQLDEYLAHHVQENLSPAAGDLAAASAS